MVWALPNDGGGRERWAKLTQRVQRIERCVGGNNRQGLKDGDRQAWSTYCPGVG